MDQGERDLSAVHRRMAEIKEEVTAEVEARWATSYRNDWVFDSKVQARLAAHEEYRALQERVRGSTAPPSGSTHSASE